MSLQRCTRSAFLLLVLIGTPCAVSAVDVAAEEAAAEEDAGLWEQIQEWYQIAKEKGERVPSDIYDWVKQDIERIGDWEYRVVEVPAAALEGELNTMGRDRWECIWIQPNGDRARLVFKRPVRSYLRNVSPEDLMKLVGGASG